MTLQQFIAKYAGRYLDLDGAYGAQCVDLVNAWAVEGLGAPRFAGNAVDIYSAYPTALYTRIPNDPAAVPLPGDIIVWGGPNPIVGTSQYGHIAVAVTATVANFVSFDQNWVEGTPCHKQAHSYDAVLGWLRPKVLHPAPAPPVPAGHPPVSAADAVDVLRRHAAALTDHPDLAETNRLIAAIAKWPVYSK